MKKLILLLTTITLAFNISAQTKENVFDGNTPLTWLGLDFSQMQYIADDKKWTEAGTVTNANLRDRYFRHWNEYFIKEPEKYDVAKATGRDRVKNAIGVTGTINDTLTRSFYTNDEKMYRLLTEEKVNSLVTAYDFQGNQGMGLLFFVEGMNMKHKGASMWVTFVNMDKKEVLWTQRMEGPPFGMGIAAYWAKSFLKVLEELPSKKPKEAKKSKR